MVDNVLPNQVARSVAKPQDTTLAGKPPVFDFGRLASQVVTYVLLVVLGFLAFMPFFWMISTSLMTLGETQIRRFTPAVPQWDNYVNAWNAAKFSQYFMNSALIAGVTIAGVVVVSVLAAYGFARIKFWGRNFAFTTMLLTLTIPEAVTLIPNYLIVTGAIFPLPIITSGTPFFSWQMGNSWINTLPALTVPFMGSAFAIFLLRQFFAQIPDELFDAARIDGAGHLRFLLQIVLPISSAPILTVVLLTFIGSWNSFLWPLIVTTTADLRPITVGLFQFRSEAGTDLHLLMAGSLIAIAPVLTLYFLTQKTFTQGIATTGLKG